MYLMKPGYVRKQVRVQLKKGNCNGQLSFR